MRSYPSRCDASGRRFAVVVARYNHLVSSQLLEGCLDELAKRGAAADDVHAVWVPGAFEIPLAARCLAASGRYDAIVTLGAVIRGGTSHFDYVCRAVTDGVREVALAHGLPVVFGVLTVDDVDQALARAGDDDENKGREAARAAIEMACLVPSLADPPPEPS